MRTGCWLRGRWALIPTTVLLLLLMLPASGLAASRAGVGVATSSPHCVRIAKVCGGNAFKVSFTAIKSPVRRGHEDTTAIATKAGAKCRLRLDDQTGKHWVTQQKAADTSGHITWHWTVPAGTPVGSWKVLADCLTSNQHGWNFHTLKVTA